MTTADKRKQLLHLADKYNVAVDRWDNIKYNVDGKEYRYNFKKTVIRVEINSGVNWVRVGSVNIKSLSLKKWEYDLDRIYNLQNGIY